MSETTGGTTARPRTHLLCARSSPNPGRAHSARSRNYRYIAQRIAKHCSADHRHTAQWIAGALLSAAPSKLQCPANCSAHRTTLLSGQHCSVNYSVQRLQSIPVQILEPLQSLVSHRNPEMAQHVAPRCSREKHSEEVSGTLARPTCAN